MCVCVCVACLPRRLAEGALRGDQDATGICNLCVLGGCLFAKGWLQAAGGGDQDATDISNLCMYQGRKLCVQKYVMCV